MADHFNSIEFDAFLIWLKTIEDRYYSEPRAFIINKKKVADFKESISKITKYIQEIDPSSQIVCEKFNISEIPVEKCGAIHIETKQICIEDIQQFIETIHLSSTVSIIPLDNGKFRLSFGYQGLLEEVKS